MTDPQVRQDAAAFVASPIRGRTAPLSGPAFIATIQNFTPPPDMLAVWFLSQESVVWKAGGMTVWIDPFLVPGAARRYPPMAAPAEVTCADIVLITHEHGDHLDPITCAGIAAASPQARFVAPPCCEPMLVQAGIPEARILTPQVGEPVQLGTWTVTAVPCAHETIDWTPERGHRWTGYIAEVRGAGEYYHAGDTVACSELLAALRPWIGRLDLAMLPINGRDYFRNADDILGNLTFREAAELAMRLDAGLTVPMHYDLFHQFNEERPAHFVDYVYDKTPYLPVAVMAPGQRLVVARRTPA